MRSPRLLSFQTKKRSFPVLFFQICQMEPRGAEIEKGMPGELEVKLNRLQTCRSHIRNLTLSRDSVDSFLGYALGTG